MTMQVSIPYIQMRGGTSRAACFLADDLPSEVILRDRVLVAIMGGPDELQVDGIGGGHPLTSKVAIVSPSQDEDADVDYLFLGRSGEANGLHKPELRQHSRCGGTFCH